MNLPSATVYITQALKTYQEGIGLQSMQVANCYLVLGKLSLMQNIMNVHRAVKFFEETLRIKQILLRNKPRSSEI